MTKKQKRIVMYLAAFLVMLALVSICLVGNTFARFTSNVYGTGSVSVAKWNVSTSGTLYDSTSASFSGANGLSPDISQTVSDPTTDIFKQETSIQKLVALEITNDTIVDAEVNLTLGDLTINYNTGCTYGNGIVSYGEATEAEIKSAVSIVLYYSTPSSQDTGTYTTVDALTTAGYTTLTQSFNAPTTVNAGDSYYLYIYGYACWTTDYTSYYVSGTPNVYIDGNNNYYADKLDAWIGKNVASISQTISVTCIQTSEVS